MIVATHQPDLLPYSGFFYKMAKSDVFDLKIYDQFLSRGYQRRVKMRDRWVSVPISPCSQHTPIVDVRIHADEGSQLLANVIRGRYGNSPYFKTRGPDVIERILDIHTNRLWQFNLELMLMVRDMLGIRTPVACGPRPQGSKSVGIVSVLKGYGADVYLSGSGGKAYMGDCAEFKEAGIDVVFSPHRAVTGDSIMTVIFDYADPLEIVFLENDDNEDAEKEDR